MRNRAPSGRWTSTSAGAGRPTAALTSTNAAAGAAGGGRGGGPTTPWGGAGRPFYTRRVEPGEWGHTGGGSVMIGDAQPRAVRALDFDLGGRRASDVGPDFDKRGGGRRRWRRARGHHRTWGVAAPPF